MRFSVALCSVLFLCNLVHATLSPDSPKKAKKQPKDAKKVKPSEKDVFQRGLVKEQTKALDILRDSSVYSKHTKIRHYVPGEILGYITPWNADGYDNAKKFHGKLDMVSPVWLTINSKDPFNIPVHDIQRTWLNDIRSADTEYHPVKVLPRVLFEGWSHDDIVEFYSNIQKRDKLIRTLIDLAENFSFDGYVLEIWNQFVFTGAKKQLIISLISLIADGLRKKDLNTILAIPPWRGMEKELFSRNNFDSLAPHIRYFSLMTYDYSNVQRPGPNAPIEWVKQCVEYLVPDAQDIKRSQILLGINFYGYHYTPTGGGAISGPQYLKLLEGFKGKFQWDPKSKEHFFELKTKEGGFVFFPTLYSMSLRLELAVELKTGVSIWELGQGLPYFFDLL